MAITAQVGAENDSPRALAEKFVGAVEQLIADLGIPATLEALQEADIPALAAAALSYVPANEASRLRGAGAGLTDND